MEQVTFDRRSVLKASLGAPALLAATRPVLAQGAPLFPGFRAQLFPESRDDSRHVRGLPRRRDHRSRALRRRRRPHGHLPAARALGRARHGRQAVRRDDHLAPPRGERPRQVPRRRTLPTGGGARRDPGRTDHLPDGGSLNLRDSNLRALNLRALNLRALNLRALNLRALNLRALNLRALNPRALNPRAFEPPCYTPHVITKTSTRKCTTRKRACGASGVVGHWFTL